MKPHVIGGIKVRTAKGSCCTYRENPGEAITVALPEDEGYFVVLML